MRRELSSQYLIKYFMGQGWNLGNTMEATRMTVSDNVVDYETAWAAPVTTQEAIDGLKKYGFNTVRVPIAWSNMISDDGKYTINPKFFDRVEEIINYCLDNEMYVIINDHYDRGWWGQFGSADTQWRDKAWARYESFWTQIAERYKEYSDRLIFESANEELGDRLNDQIDETTGYATGTNQNGVLTEDELYELVNQINQKFVDIVRGTGGNNTYRHLLIAGYNTDFDMTVDSELGRFIMPKDPSNEVNKLSVSVHYYTPSTYGIAETEDNSWGYMGSWGTDSDIAEMKTNFEKLKKFYDQGYGVMIGEYGVVTATKKGIPDYYYYVMKNSKDMGYLPIMWDTGLWYNRATGLFKYGDVLEKILEITGSQADIPADADVTGKDALAFVDNDEFTKVFTWEGQWKKNDGSNVGLDGNKVSSEDIEKFVTTTTESSDMNIIFNTWGYQVFLGPDWSKFTSPSIRVYFETDDADVVGALTMAYCDAPNGSWNGTTAYEYSSGYSTEYVPVDIEQLEKHNVLMITFGNSPIVTRIEIYDSAK
ncbi:MAG: glycoside hydrolase family 5 protein [Anaerolineaceae bacterium]|nr:MAG: glycoside hydrolase family 5 protein [Anaerolineaceae bacterium]